MALSTNNQLENKQTDDKKKFKLFSIKKKTIEDVCKEDFNKNLFKNQSTKTGFTSFIKKIFKKSDKLDDSKLEKSLHDNIPKGGTEIIQEAFDKTKEVKEILETVNASSNLSTGKLGALGGILNLVPLSDINEKTNKFSFITTNHFPKDAIDKLLTNKESILKSNLSLKIDLNSCNETSFPTFSEPIDHIEREIDLVEHTDVTNNEEIQYINLVKEIIQNGYSEMGRNGETLTKFGHSMRFTLRNGKIPLLTTKKIAWKSCFEELFWFIRGATSNYELREKNVHIWNGNSSREFLDSRGLYYLEEGDLGPIYGFQWRHYNAEYSSSSKCYEGMGVDQLQEIIDTLKNPKTRTSRRMILTAWNPCQINYMALPPCHILAQFHVRENRYLSCALYQRSGDVGLGVPFNIASYSLLTHILAKHCGLEADEFVHFLGNCHIYKEHIEPLTKQSELSPFSFPSISIQNIHDNIEDYCLEDIVWTKKYESHSAIKMEFKA